MGLSVDVRLIRRVMWELNEPAEQPRPLVVGGARELAAALRRELARGAKPGGVRDDDAPEGAGILVYVLGGEPTEEDRRALLRARSARVPVVVVVAGRAGEELSLPWVLATDVLRVAPGEGFPIPEIAEAVARRLGNEAAALAGRLPVLRGPVSEEIVTAFARKNAVVGAVVFVPGADLPVLTLNQIRMLVRLGQAHGRDTGRDLLTESAVTVAAGLGLRALARQLLDLVPGAGWAVKGAVAYAGTRALGEAAVRRLGSALEVEGAPGGDGDDAS
ncbi:MAG TPA: hypothetical protein VMT74_07265 [Gaiellaceae bacterium]|nr:hypothetical protein [Gaiellaceae bacterium]